MHCRSQCQGFPLFAGLGSEFPELECQEHQPMYGCYTRLDYKYYMIYACVYRHVDDGVHYKCMCS